MAVAGCIIPFAVLLVRSLLAGPVALYGDDAVNELNVDRALRARQLVGPYSRFGWHHPGPALAYLAVPARALLGPNGHAQEVTAICLNGLCAAVLIWLCGRRLGWSGVIGAVLAVQVLMLGAGPGFVREPWNPFVITFPVALIVILAADAAMGHAWSLVGVVLVGSVIVQTHVSTFAAVGAVTVMAAAAGLWRAREVAPRVLALSAGAMLLLWAPPLVQQMTSHPGNLGLLVRFARTAGTGAGAGVASRALLFPWWVLFGHVPDRAARVETAPVWLALVAGLTVACGIWAALRSTGLVRMGLAGCGVGLVAAWVVDARTTGGLFSYLLVWQTGLVAAVLGLLVMAALRLATAAGTRRVVTVGFVGVAIAAVAVNLARSTGAPLQKQVPQVADVWTAVRSRLGPTGQTVTIDIKDPQLWFYGAGLAAELEDHGWRFDVVPSQWRTVFGEAHLPSGRGAIIVSVANSSQATPSSFMVDGLVITVGRAG
jgi:hypothetical protein